MRRTSLRACGGRYEERRCTELRRTSLRACGGRYEERRCTELRRTSLRSYILRRVLTSTVVKYCGHGSNRTKGRSCGGCYEGRRYVAPTVGVRGSGGVRDYGACPFAPAAGVRGSGGVRDYGARPFAPAAGVRGSGGVRQCGVRLFVPIFCGAFSPLPWSSTVGVALSEARGAPAAGVMGGRRYAGLRCMSLRSCIGGSVLTSTVVKYCGCGSKRSKGRACGGCYEGRRYVAPAADVRGRRYARLWRTSLRACGGR
jgi:hypothetical protein